MACARTEGSALARASFTAVVPALMKVVQEALAGFKERVELERHLWQAERWTPLIDSGEARARIGRIGGGPFWIRREDLSRDRWVINRGARVP